MSDNFEVLLNNAMRMCEGEYPEAFLKHFQLIYPFTTENISGYINEFKLKNGSLLTVGSSGDQVICAILMGCIDITVFDINPYTKFYYYLKVVAIQKLEIDEFFTFFRLKDFPKIFKDNREAFNKKTYYKLKETLRLLDYESYLFWDELFESYNPLKIRERLFEADEDRTSVIKAFNLYLSSEKSYIEARKKINKVKPKFVNGDLLNDKLDRKYDSIWLSNIGTWIDLQTLKSLVDKMRRYLSSQGKLLISYLYSTKKDTKYRSDWSEIYNLEKTFEILKEHNPYMVSFIGVRGLIFEDEKLMDSVLLCDN